MIKVLFNVFLLVIALIVYDRGIRPYNEAKNEEETILKSAGITVEEKSARENKGKSIPLLEANCKNGFYQHNDYEYGCVSGTFLPFLD